MLQATSSQLKSCSGLSLSLSGSIRLCPSCQLLKELPFSDVFDDVEVGVDAPDNSNVKESPVALSAQVSDLSAILKRFTLQF